MQYHKMGSRGEARELRDALRAVGRMAIVYRRRLPLEYAPQFKVRTDATWKECKAILKGGA